MYRYYACTYSLFRWSSDITCHSACYQDREKLQCEYYWHHQGMLLTKTSVEEKIGTLHSCIDTRNTFVIRNCTVWQCAHCLRAMWWTSIVPTGDVTDFAFHGDWKQVSVSCIASPMMRVGTDTRTCMANGPSGIAVWMQWCRATWVDNTVGSKHTENQCHTYCISVSKMLDISAMRSKSVPNSGTDWIIFATNNQCHWHYFSAFNGTDFHQCRHWVWHWFSLMMALIFSHIINYQRK